ncbi:MAG: hypothetical protein JO222_07185 [Frankiales bacterium]|nr:hypothetical protein [Frankiales bacterium]
MNRTAHIRPVIGAVAVAVMAVSGIAAHAAPAKKAKPIVRHQTISYTGGCGIIVNAVAAAPTAAPGTCAVGSNYTVVHKTGEKYLTISVVDQTGRPISGEIWLTGGTGNATLQRFCGTLKHYTMGQASYQLDLNTGVDPTCPGEPTQGKINLTFSSK